MADLPPLALVIIDYVRSQGRVTNKDIVRGTAASPNTVKTVFTKLVKQRLLVRHGGGNLV
ncbi:MAG: DeoR family transcriptional regulator [Cellvibrionaceae bacterium]|nr:DeoR family transcriptional regulator [Cellvibrionaceae bacterium]